MGFMASVNKIFVKLGQLFAVYLKTRRKWKEEDEAAQRGEAAAATRKVHPADDDESAPSA